METHTLPPDLISAAGILSQLGANAETITLQLHSCTDSTNLLARAAAAQNADEGLVILAGMQTAGRGRLGRSFFSPGDTGLYMSILLRPKLKAEQSVLITTAAAVAVCKAIEEICGKQPQIKWVNDIFLDDRKVCGILTEAVFPSGCAVPEYLICGIGINVYPPAQGFPAELSNIAGAVCHTVTPELRNRLAAAVLRHFFTFYRLLPEKTYMNEYRSRSMVIGKEIRILQNGSTENAFAEAIDDEAGLIVRLPDGSSRTLSTGEISIRLQNT